MTAKTFVLGALACLFGDNAFAQTCTSYPYTLANGATADASQVMADFNCLPLLGSAIFTAPVALGSSTELLSLNSGSVGFNRRVNDGHIYNSGVYAYQFQHVGSSSPGSDYLQLQVYTPSGTSVTGAAFEVNGSGNVSIGGSWQSGYSLTVSGNAWANSWVTPSDARLKSDIEDIPDALQLVVQLRGVTYVMAAD